MANQATQKLSFLEKAGYSGGDSAANFVFMTMILFQTNFYTDVFGLSVAAASAILLWPKLWDAAFDPIMGVIADRTKTRWGKFRPWILWTAVPWAVVMVLAYTTPKGWSYGALIAYAAITNTILMTLYSMNNMPYAALGGVMTGDVNERTSLNSYRFVAVNIAQFIVGGFTLPLVAKFAVGHDRAYGWQMTMTIWAVLCLVLFLITFLTTRERIEGIANPPPAPVPDDSSEAKAKSSWRLATLAVAVVGALLFWASWRYLNIPFTPQLTIVGIGALLFRALIVAGFLYAVWNSLSPLVQLDFRDLARNKPWRVMFAMTLVHFAILSFRGGALYNYYHQYVDKAAMFDFVEKLGLTGPVLAEGAPKPGGLLEWLGYIVHGTRDQLGSSNVADVFNSIINMVGTATTIIVIILSPPLSRKFGKKAIAVAGFGLSALGTFAFYLLSPTNVGGMTALTILIAIVYAPTIPLVWAIYADVADYSELKTGRRFTGMVFATIGFALKSGLAIGQASFLWIMWWLFKYDTKFPSTPEAVAGYRFTSGIIVGLLFAICTVLLMLYQLNKHTTIEMAEELAARRARAAGA